MNNLKIRIMKKQILLNLILISNLVYAQCDGRYQDEIFSDISKTTVHNLDAYSMALTSSVLSFSL